MATMYAKVRALESKTALLEPGHYHKDDEVPLYHFRTPSGEVFAVEDKPTDRKRPKVTFGNSGISIVPTTPELSDVPGCCVPTKWTLTGGYWERKE